MGLVKKILAGIAAIGAALALWYRGQAQKAKRKRAQDRADRATAAVEQHKKTGEALRETRQRHREEREPPDTEARDDFEEDW